MAADLEALLDESDATSMPAMAIELIESDVAFDEAQGKLEQLEQQEAQEPAVA